MDRDELVWRTEPSADPVTAQCWPFHETIARAAISPLCPDSNIRAESFESARCDAGASAVDGDAAGTKADKSMMNNEFLDVPTARRSCSCL